MLTDDERRAFLAAAEEAGLLVHPDDVEAFFDCCARAVAELDARPPKRDPFSMRVTFTITCSTPHERAARVHP